MDNANCIFCKIISGQIPSAKIFENEEFICILDIYPNVKGASLVIPKKHITSDVFEADFELVHKSMDIAKICAAKLKKSLRASRVALITEGIMIDHLHLKLYPVYGEEEFKGGPHTEEPEPVYFEQFPGYLTTQLGPQWSGDELSKLAELVRDTNA